MTRINISSVIDEGFIKSFQGVAQQRSGGNSLASALQGGSSQVSITTGLRLGAQAFASSVGGLNSLIGFINIASDSMSKIADITDELINIADTASKSETGSQERKRLNSRYRELVGDFRDQIEKTQYSGRNLLDVSDLESIFATLGFDGQKSNSVKAIFGEFDLVRDDTTLASENAKGDRPIPIPPEAFKIRTPSGTKFLTRVTQEYESIFASERKIDNRPDAYRLKYDLIALKDQISKNQSALSDAVSFLESNVSLVRTAGLALLDLTNSISSSASAEEVAKLLRDKIIRAPSTALNQLENLEPLVVAALTLDEKSTGA